MKFFIVLFALVAVATCGPVIEPDTFDIVADVKGYIDEANDRIRAARNASMMYVDKQEASVCSMINQVSTQLQSTNANLKSSLSQFLTQYVAATSNKTRANLIQNTFNQYLTATQKAVDDIRLRSLPTGVKKTPEAITEDLRKQVDNITTIAMGDTGKYSINRDLYNCRYMYHTRLISDYFLFAAKNNGYCVDFLNYQIFGDSAEMLQLLFHSYDQQIDLLEEALRALDVQAVLAVSTIFAMLL